jgi:oligopeptide transport system substrate-binding protein
MRRKLIWLISCLLIISILSTPLTGCGGSVVQGGAEVSTQSMQIGSLKVSPEKAGPGQSTAIEATVSNTGKAAAKYTAVLKINDSPVETREVSIPAGDKSTISFNYVPAASGQYKIDLNGMAGIISVAKPAEFQVASVDIIPAEIVAGSSITVNAEVKNIGESDGKYTAKLNIDGNQAATKDATINPAASQKVALTAKMDTAGSHTIDIGGVTKTITVLKPAEIKVSSVKVTPELVFPGQEAVVEAEVINIGEVKSNLPLGLNVNGLEADSQAVALEPNKTGKVSFKMTQSAGGKYDIKIGSASASINIPTTKTYNNTLLGYSITYPNEWAVNDTKRGKVVITSGSALNVTIEYDYGAVTMSLDEAYRYVKQDLMKDNPNIQLLGEKDLTPPGKLLDYSYNAGGSTTRGNLYLIKRGAFIYTVKGETPDSAWENNKQLIIATLTSLKPPLVATGTYTDSLNGYSLTVPEGWCAMETGDKLVPLAILNPSSANMISVVVGIDTVDKNASVKEIATRTLNTEYSRFSGYKLISQGNITVGTITGYDIVFSYNYNSTTEKMRFVSFTRGTQDFSLIVYGKNTTFDAKQSTIDQLVKSFAFVEPKPYGVSRQDSIFLWQGDIVTLDPALTLDGPDDIVAAVFSGLVKIDKDLKAAPDLAEKWEVSSDGLTYTFHLRPYAKFQDGKPVTAQDIKFSWERALNPATKSHTASTYLDDIVGAQDILQGKASDLSGLKIIDPNTISVTIDGAKPYFLSKLAQPVAFIVDKANVVKGASWYDQPNGTGPFKIKQWTKDQVLILERNNNFYLEPAKLKNIVFRIYAGQPTMMYENGDIDIAQVSSSELDKVTDKSNPLNIDYVSGKSIDIGYLGFNVTRAPFDDLKVRQAFALALDINKLVEVSLKGRADRTGSLVPPGIPGYNKDLPPFSFDATAARKLISESKYGSVDNLPSITLSVNHSASPMQTAIISMWKQNLGVTVQVEAIKEYKDFYEKLYNHEFQIFTYGWRADYVDPQNFLETLFQSKSTVNHFAYSNPTVDAALKDAAVEPDPAKRQQKYQEIEKMILNDLPAVPLYCSVKSSFLVKPYVKSFSVFPTAVNIWRDMAVAPH